MLNEHNIEVIGLFPDYWSPRIISNFFSQLYCCIAMMIVVDVDLSLSGSIIRASIPYRV